MRSVKSIHDAYELMGMAGAGQYGRVYCARRRSDQRLVALKELSSQRFPTQNLLRELRFLLMLDHPHITRCEALEHTREGRYLVLEYCEGGTLRELIEQTTPLTARLIVQWVTQILSGLAHAHAAGVVHCDVKPENILLRLTRGGWLLKLTDFGIARAVQPSEAELSATGSAAYMAPERFYGQFSPAVDLYAVGVILYELLVGERPFSGSPGQLMQQHLNQRVRLGRAIPAPLRPILQQALEKLPGRRYASAQAMLTDLEHAVPLLKEPDTCWVGPLLPTWNLTLAEAVTLPQAPNHWVDQGSRWVWSNGGSLWETDQHTHHHTLLADFEQPITGLETVAAGLLIATPDRLYYQLPGQPPSVLRHFAHPWRYSWSALDQQMAWTTAQEYGLIHFQSSSLLPTSHPLLGGRSFYHSVLPAGLTEPPLVMMANAMIILGIRRQHHMDLWQHHSLGKGWFPIDFSHSPAWQLPILLDTGIPVTNHYVLAPLDPTTPVLLMHSHPLLIRRLYTPTPYDSLRAAPWGFTLVTNQRQVFTFTSSGIGLGQTVLPYPLHHLAIDGAIWMHSPHQGHEPVQLLRAVIVNPEASSS